MNFIRIATVQMLGEANLYLDSISLIVPIKAQICINGTRSTRKRKGTCF